MWASLVARCAGKDKFFGLTDMIMKTQNKWARAENDLAIVGDVTSVISKINKTIAKRKNGHSKSNKSNIAKWCELIQNCR